MLKSAGKQLISAGLLALPLTLVMPHFSAHSQEPATGAVPPTANVPDTQIGKGIGNFLSGLGKSISNTVSGERDTLQFNDLKPGIYIKSSEAIGDEQDLKEARITKGLLSVPSFTKYANEVLDRIKAATPLQQVPGSVYVVANEQLDAYSTADGNIFISGGYLRSITTEDQLAALLAHELSHVLLRHHDTNFIGRAQKQVSSFTTTGPVFIIFSMTLHFPLCISTSLLILNLLLGLIEQL